MDNSKKTARCVMEIAEITISAVLITLTGLMAGSIVIGIIVSAILQMVSGSFYQALNESISATITSNFSFLMIIIFLILYVKIFKKKNLKDMLYLHKGRSKIKMVFAGILTGFVLCSIAIAVPVINGDIILKFNRFDILITPLVFLSIYIQSSAEEIVLRGYVYGSICQVYTEWAAIILNSLVFSFLHLNNNGINLTGIINIILFGFLFSLLYSRTKSLEFVCGIHAMWGFTEEIIFGLPNSGKVFGMPVFCLVESRQALFYNEKFGIEANIQTIFIALAVLAVLLYNRNKNENIL